MKKKTNIKYRVIEYILFDNEIPAKINIETEELMIIDDGYGISWDDSKDIKSQIKLIKNQNV